MPHVRGIQRSVPRVDPVTPARYITDRSVSMKSDIAPPSVHAAIAPPPRQRRKDARPQELLDAALELFVAKGFAATRTEEVAARAGVSKGTLYLYFPSKEELLKEVIRHHVVNRIAQGVDIIRQFSGTTSELLALVMRMWWEAIGETPASGIIKLMHSEVRNFPDIAQFYVDEVVTPSNRMLEELLQRGIDRGEFRPILVHDVMLALTGPLIFLTLNQHSLGACSTLAGLDAHAVIEAQIDMVLHGLEAHPQKAARR